MRDGERGGVQAEGGEMMTREEIQRLEEGDFIQFTKKFSGVTVGEPYFVHWTPVGRLVNNDRGLGAYLADLLLYGAEFEKVFMTKATDAEADHIIDTYPGY